MCCLLVYNMCAYNRRKARILGLQSSIYCLKRVLRWSKEPTSFQRANFLFLLIFHFVCVYFCYSDRKHIIHSSKYTSAHIKLRLILFPKSYFVRTEPISVIFPYCFCGLYLRARTNVLIVLVINVVPVKHCMYIYIYSSCIYNTKTASCNLSF